MFVARNGKMGFVPIDDPELIRAAAMGISPTVWRHWKKSQGNTNAAAKAQCGVNAAIAAHEKQRQQSALAVTVKGNETMPATATAPRNGAPKDHPRKYAEPQVGLAQPRLVTPALKAFDTAQEALDAGMAMLAGACRAVPNRTHPVAENYCRQRGLQVMNTASSASPTGGGYIVPDELARAILKRMTRVGWARRLAFVSPMTSGSQSIPWETSGLTVEYIIEAPVSAPTPSDISWGSIGLAAEKRGVLGYISAELDADTLIPYVDTYVDRAAHALAKREDREFILGDGTSTYGGEVGLLASLGAGGIHTAATGHDTWPELDVDDYAACMAKLPEDFADGRESWICSAAHYAVGMLGAVGGASQGFAEDGRPLFLGKPVNLLPAMPATAAASTVCALYGSWSEVAVLGNRGITFAASDKAPGAFERDLIAVKAFSRYDIAIHNAGTASAAGGYVGLATAA